MSAFIALIRAVELRWLVVAFAGWADCHSVCCSYYWLMLALVMGPALPQICIHIRVQTVELILEAREGRQGARSVS